MQRKYYKKQSEIYPNFTKKTEFHIFVLDERIKNQYDMFCVLRKA